MKFQFAYPYFLFLFLFVFYFIYLYFFKKTDKQNSSYIKYSNIESIKKSLNIKFLNRDNIINLMRILALSFLIIAMARPRTINVSEELLTQGYEIILCMDTSTSMRAEDFKPDNRMFVAREVAKDFVKKRPYDKIGIVVFSQIAYTLVPLTTDHNTILNFLDKVEIAMTETDGTAIGNAIAVSANRIKNTPSKSKIIILLTDGANNAGEIDPITASQSASKLGIKIYTIGVGAEGQIPYPIDDPVFGRRYVNIESDLDENLLSKIAELTDANYFRATDSKSLEKIYDMIDQLEKSEIKIKQHVEYKELFFYFILAGLILFIIELLLTTILWIKVP